MDIPSQRAVRWTLLGGVVAVGFLTWVELTSHGSRHVELAVASMTKGDQAGWFNWGLSFGVLAPAGLAVVTLSVDDTSVVIPAVAGVLALVGMWLSETAFIRAGQSVPLS
jgi:hypothetical protein